MAPAEGFPGRGGHAGGEEGKGEIPSGWRVCAPRSVDFMPDQEGNDPVGGECSGKAMGVVEGTGERVQKAVGWRLSWEVSLKANQKPGRSPGGFRDLGLGGWWA